MENWTVDNFYIVGLAMLKIAYNFWPVIVFCIGYAMWETYISRARVKSKIANSSDSRGQYSRDASQHVGRRHL